VLSVSTFCVHIYFVAYKEFYKLSAAAWLLLYVAWFEKCIIIDVLNFISILVNDEHKNICVKHKTTK